MKRRRFLLRSAAWTASAAALAVVGCSGPSEPTPEAREAAAKAPPDLAAANNKAGGQGRGRRSRQHGR